MQTYHRVHVQLGKKDRKQIAGMLNKGRESARVLRRALILRQLDQGQTAAQVASNVGVAPKTVRAIARRYEEEGLEPACMRSRVRASSGCWTRARARGSSPWCAVHRRKAGHGGACGSSPKKR